LASIAVPTTRSRNIDTIFKFDSKGRIVKSFGRGMFIWPHGLHVDRGAIVWRDRRRERARREMAAKAGVHAGHQIFKFSPEGKC